MSLFCFIGKHLKTISRLSLVVSGLCITFSTWASDDILPQLQDQAEQFVYSQLIIDPTSQVEVNASEIDSRRQLHACPEHITASVAGNGEIKRNTAVKLSCDSDPRWEIFVPVRVKILRPFVTVSQAVAKSTTLSAENLKVEFMEEVLMRGDSFDNIEKLIGTRSKRDLRPGQPVRSNQICVICKDDTVEIVAETGGISIRTAGKALQDASYGEQLRVENLRSHKVISAQVVAVGVVKVEM